MSGAPARRLLWRGVLRATGGLRVEGPVPAGPCVVVANHASHADTAALLAALPASPGPVVAAAADYWFAGAARAAFCRSFVAGFPVRRSGRGFDDLLGAAGLLALGHQVVVFPEGTRSRSGAVGAFRSGAARLAEHADVPLVPVGLSGTADLLPVGGGLRRAAVTVRFGEPTRDPVAARDAVRRLAGGAEAGAGSGSAESAESAGSAQELFRSTSRAKGARGREERTSWGATA